MKHLSGYPYGETLRNTFLSGFTLTETAYASSLKLPKHSHDQAYFCFVLDGTFTEIYGKRELSCRPSTLVFHPAGETHSDYFHSSARCFNIQMDSCWWAHVEQQSKVIKTPADFYGGRLAHLATRLYREFRESDEFSALVIEGITLEIIAEVSRCFVNESERTPPRWLEQVRGVLHEQFGERLSLVTLAESVNVHPVHVAREFRRFYGSTVSEYVRQRRIEFTCHRLKNSDASLSEIAQAAGFFDHSHFTRTFKTQMGMTPSQYRTALRPR